MLQIALTCSIAVPDISKIQRVELRLYRRTRTSSGIRSGQPQLSSECRKFGC